MTTSRPEHAGADTIERAGSGRPFQRIGLVEELVDERIQGAEAGEEDTLAALFSAEEELVARAVSKRRREFAAGRSCARRALKKFGRDPAAIVSGAGSPPRWPPGFVGSITHTEGYAAAVVAPRGELISLGLDAERIGRLGEDLERLIATPAERDRYVTDKGSEEAEHLRTLLFSAKEAAYKCQFPVTGTTYDFLEAEATLPGAPAETGTFEIRFEEKNGSPNAPVLRGRYICRGDFVLTLAFWPTRAEGDTG